MMSIRVSTMRDRFMKAMRFGRHSRLIDAPELMPPPLSAILGWAVAHGADGEIIHPGPPPSIPLDSDGGRAR